MEQSHGAKQFVGLFDCEADEEDELGFMEGDVIYVLQVISDEWFFGRLKKDGSEGLVPFNYVEPLQEELLNTHTPDRFTDVDRYADWRQSFDCRNKGASTLSPPVGSTPFPPTGISPPSISLSSRPTPVVTDEDSTSSSAPNVASPAPTASTSPSQQSSSNGPSLLESTPPSSTGLFPLFSSGSSSSLSAPSGLIPFSEPPPVELPISGTPPNGKRITRVSPSPLNPSSPIPAPLTTSTSTSTPPGLIPKGQAPRFSRKRSLKGIDSMTQSFDERASSVEILSLTSFEKEDLFSLSLKNVRQTSMMGDEKIIELLRNSRNKEVFRILEKWWTPPVFPFSDLIPERKQLRSEVPMMNKETIELIVSGKSKVEEGVLECLILNHTLVMSSVDLMDLIVSSYRQSIVSDDLETRTQLCLIVRIWIVYFRPEFNDASLFLILDQFVKELDSSISCDVELRNSLLKFESFWITRESWRRRIVSAFSSQSGMKSKRPLEEFNADEVAGHLTVWEWGLQMGVTSQDLAKGQYRPCKAHFRVLSEWVHQRLVDSTNVALTIKFYLDVLVRCFQMMNLASVHSILHGFHLSGFGRVHFEERYEYVIQPLNQIFQSEDPMYYHSFVSSLRGTAFLPSLPMLFANDTTMIKKKGKKGKALEGQNLNEMFSTIFREYYSAVILPERLKYFEENESNFLYPLNPPICYELGLIRVGQGTPRRRGSTKNSLTDPHSLFWCSSGFDLEMPRDNAKDPSSFWPSLLVDIEHNDAIFKREFYNTTPPPLCLLALDNLGRPFLIILGVYTDSESLEKRAMAVIFTVLSIGEGDCVNRVLKGLDPNVFESDKKLASALIVALSGVLPFDSKPKHGFKQVNLSRNLQERLLRLEAVSMCQQPHLFGVVHHRKGSSRLLKESMGGNELYGDGQSATFQYFLRGLAKGETPGAVIDSRYRELEVQYQIAPLMTGDDPVRALDRTRVVIVFSEPGSSPFSPADFPHATFLFIIVSPCAEEGEESHHYKVAVASKDNINSPIPALKSKFLSLDELILFVVTKAINADRRSFRIVPQLWRSADEERLSIIKSVAELAVHTSEVYVSKARKRASTALQGALDLGHKGRHAVVGSGGGSSHLEIPGGGRGSSGGAGSGGAGNSASAGSVAWEGVPVELNDKDKILPTLKSCFVQRSAGSSSTTPRKKMKKFIFSLNPVLSSPLISLQTETDFPDHPGMTFSVLDRICSFLEGKKNSKVLQINPFVSVVNDALAALDKHAGQEHTSFLNDRFMQIFPVEAWGGVIWLWLIHNKGSVMPQKSYDEMINLVVDGRMPFNSVAKLIVLFQGLPSGNYFTIERILRMCAFLSAGSYSQSDALAELVSVILFAPKEVRLDILFKIKIQKQLIKYCIEHHSSIFVGPFPPLSATPISLVTSLSSSSKPETPSTPKDRAQSMKDRRKSFKKTLSVSLVNHKKVKKIEGEYARVFSLRDSGGTKVSLTDLVTAGGRTILFFFSRDTVSRSTLKLFKANHDLFSSARCSVLGICPSKMSSLADDAASLRLPFTLLTDPSGKVRQKYSVTSGKNATFVLNECGEMIHSFESSDATTDHVLHALYGLILQIAGFYLFSSRTFAHHFEYFYSIQIAGADGAIDRSNSFENETIPGVAKWDELEVGNWLDEVGLAELSDLFEENQLKGLDLLDMEMVDLEDDLGLKGHSLLPVLISELNLLRVSDAKRKFQVGG